VRYTDEHARFVSDLGASIIVMGTVPRAPFSDGDYDADVPRAASERVADQVRRMAEAAARHGVTIALHTDAYSVCGRDQDIATMMQLTDPATVGLCLDAGHTALDGGDPVAVLRAHVDRVPVMHWKDCVAPLDGSTLTGDQMTRHERMLQNFRIFGEGSIDWRAWQSVLRDADWSGWAMAENDMSADPVGEIVRSLDFFDRELAGIHR
jgi:inosose dehydratase